MKTRPAPTSSLFGKSMFKAPCDPPPINELIVDTDAEFGSYEYELAVTAALKAQKQSQQDALEVAHVVQAA
jgi:hypothetical protein